MALPQAGERAAYFGPVLAALALPPPPSLTESPAAPPPQACTLMCCPVPDAPGHAAVQESDAPLLLFGFQTRLAWLE